MTTASASCLRDPPSASVHETPVARRVPGSKATSSTAQFSSTSAPSASAAPAMAVLTALQPPVGWKTPKSYSR